jgi:hypothetical protein
MTSIQQILGTILINRINAELKKDKASQDFTSIKDTLDIFLAGDRITVDQHTELEDLMTPATN